MDSLRIIPQFFYDVIGRILPGSAAIVGFALAMEIPLDTLLASSISPSSKLKDSILFILTLFVALSYMLGHLMGVFHDILRKILKDLCFSDFNVLRKWICPLPHANDNFKSSTLKKEFDDTQQRICRENDKDEYTTVLFIWYDWLRVEYPDVGNRITKLRAEYTMRAGIASAALLSLICHLFAIWRDQTNYNVYLVGGCIFVFVVAVFSYKKAYKIFQISIINHYCVAKCLDSGVGDNSGEE
ncbi:hypothetical protein [Kaarinaea lacus]